MAGVHSQVHPRTVWTIGLNVLAMAGLIWIAWNAWTVISWILIALFLALALEPVVRLLVRHTGMRRGHAVGIIFVMLVVLIVVLAMSFIPMLGDQINSLVRNAPGYLAELKQHKWMSWADQRFGLFERVNAELGNLGRRAAGPVLGIVKGAVEVVAATVTIISLTLFMLLWGRQLFTAGLTWLPPMKRARFDTVARRMTGTVGGYITGTFFVSILGGIVTATSLLILGVPYFLPLGVAMVVLGVIPWVGSALGAVLVVSTTFASAGTKKGLIALVVFLVWQQVENRITPLIQARTVKMNALLVAIVMLVGTAIMGLLGALLSVPLAGALQVVAQDVLRRREERWRAKLLRAPHEHAEGQLELFEREPEQHSVH